MLYKHWKCEMSSIHLILVESVHRFIQHTQEHSVYQSNFLDTKHVYAAENSTRHPYFLLS